MNKIKSNKHVKQTPFIEIFAYGLGDFGNNFSWMFVGSFLMIFYTDVFGISIGAVGTLMLITRIWDAVNDPIIGILADKTRTRWGRYRPWLLIGAPLTGILLIFTFWAHPDWNMTSKIVYMYITYSLLVVGYTSVNLPYGTLAGAISQNIDERTLINTSRSLGAMIAIGLISIITVPLIEKLGHGNEQMGYLYVAIIYAVVFTASHLFCFSYTRETVAVPKKQKISYKKHFKLISKNYPFFIAVAGQLLFGFTLYGRNAGMLYYFKYVEGDAGLFTFFSIAIIIPSIVGAALFPFAYKLTSNKGWASSLFAIAMGIMMIALYFFSPNTSPVLFYLFAGLSQLFFSGFNTGIYAIIPDCVEYGELKTGIRNDGFQYSFISLANKVGMAVGTSFLALVLSLTGYAPNVVQNNTVLSVMQHSFSTFPGIMWILTGILLFFYKINRKNYNQILSILEYKKSKANNNETSSNDISRGN